ncbi:hypothetical protein PR048_011026 [Dryococelus australis]|uniref:Uncharacterized protein n=1 Tax=Dryococelus australis TaxID=614101 RepID=A0ABQ9HKY3_9NEOP|nr:hypothetical protein PR048_011026 [Dryococelus australis]
MDQSVIKIFKHFYRWLLVENILTANEEKKKAGFSQPRNTNDIQDKTQEDNEEEIMPAVAGFGDLTLSVSYKEFFTLDNNVVVCREQMDAEIVAELSCRVHCSGSSDEENNFSELPVQPLQTSVETMDYIHKLQRYFEEQQNISDTVFKSLNILEDSVVAQRLK